MEGIFFETENGLDLMSPESAQKLNDTTLSQLGYSVAWVGWQARMQPTEFGLKVLVADVHGAVRATFADGDMTPDHKGFDLVGNDFYCARDTVERKATLRILTSFDDPGTIVPRNTWHFAAIAKNKDARCGVVFDQAAATNTYFSLIYEGENPEIAGLGEAALRDFASYLKNRGASSEINGSGRANTIVGLVIRKVVVYCVTSSIPASTQVRMVLACSMACLSSPAEQDAVLSIIVTHCRGKRAIQY